MISNLGSIEGELRTILAHIEEGNSGFARQKLAALIGSLSETPLGLITIDTQAVRAMERANEKRIEEEKDRLAIEYQTRFDERLEANGLKAE